MIDRWEVLDDVEPQHVAVAASILLQLVDGAVRAFANAIGVAVWMKLGFKEWLDDVAQGVMDNPIPKRGGADFASFWLVDDEVLVRAGLVAAIAQIVL